MCTDSLTNTQVLRVVWERAALQNCTRSNMPKSPHKCCATPPEGPNALVNTPLTNQLVSESDPSLNCTTPPEDPNPVNTPLTGQ